MSIGPSPSDENIDFKVRPHESDPRTRRSNPVLAILLVCALVLILAIVFIQQRKLGDLEGRVNGLRNDVDQLKQMKSH